MTEEQKHRLAELRARQPKYLAALAEEANFIADEWRAGRRVP